MFSAFHAENAAGTAAFLIKELNREIVSKVDFGPSPRFSPFQNLTPISAKESIKRKVKKCEVRNNQGKEKPRNQLISGFLVREAGLEPARPEWTLEPESEYKPKTSVFSLFFLRKMGCSYCHTIGEKYQIYFCSDFVRNTSRVAN